MAPLLYQTGPLRSREPAVMDGMSININIPIVDDGRQGVGRTTHHKARKRSDDRRGRGPMDGMTWRHALNKGSKARSFIIHHKARKRSDLK
eukprot:scaffold33426_cov46-Attheya_sp.AAC.2